MNVTTLPPCTPASQRTHGDIFVRRMIGIYIFLWFAEGSLRKWFLPEYNAPLLVIRDPFLLLAYIQAFSSGKFPVDRLTSSTALLGVVSLLASLVASETGSLLANASGFTSVAVVIFGLRANFLHLPLILLIPVYFDREDVVRMGRYFCYLAPAMAVLVYIQFHSSPDAWINAAAGGEGRQIETAHNKIRAAGVFSYTNGLVGYATLLVVFLTQRLLEPATLSRIVFLAAGASVAILVGLSGSRSAVGSAIGVWFALGYVCLRKPALAPRAILLFPLVILGIAAIAYNPATSEGLDVLEERFGGEDEVRTGFAYRFLGDFTSPLLILPDVPFFGYGLGMGTNAGAALVVGKRAFLLAEGDFARVLLESGPILGLAFMILRAAYVARLFQESRLALQQRVDALPMLLLGACWYLIFSGQFGQPTALGYAVIAGGLCLAACRVPVASASPEVGPTDPPVTTIESGIPARRGRSAYAERLHGGR